MKERGGRERGNVDVMIDKNVTKKSEQEKEEKNEKCMKQEEKEKINGRA